MVPLRRVVVAFIAIAALSAMFVFRAHRQTEEARLAADKAEAGRKEEEARRRALEAELAKQTEAIAAAQAEAANAKSDAERAAAQAKLAAAQSAATHATAGGGGGSHWAPKGSLNCAPGDPLCSSIADPSPPTTSSTKSGGGVKGIIAPQ